MPNQYNCIRLDFLFLLEQTIAFFNRTTKLKMFNFIANLVTLEDIADLIIFQRYVKTTFKNKLYSCDIFKLLDYPTDNELIQLFKSNIP